MAGMAAMIRKNSSVKSFPDLKFETQLWKAGYQKIAGIDEVGRGALAGPVAAGVVIFPMNEEILENLDGINDSKQLTPKKRISCAHRIKLAALEWGIGYADSKEIDQLGIISATQLAVRRALNELTVCPDFLLFDFLPPTDYNLPLCALVKGDTLSLSIASASILAKVARDNLLIQLDQEYPGYGLAQHKGYGTRKHREALIQLGPSHIHRLTFSPIKISDSIKLI
jgi:ribonuclease HII